MTQAYQVSATQREIAKVKTLTGERDAKQALAQLVVLAGRGRLARYPFSKPLDVSRLRPAVKAALQRDQRTGAIKRGRIFDNARDAIEYLKRL